MPLPLAVDYAQLFAFALSKSKAGYRGALHCLTHQIHGKQPDECPRIRERMDIRVL
jgi:hypothetical protein